MTPDERNLLNGFLQDLGQARGGLKDAEAADMIDRSLRANPDAAYLLVQHAIISDQALHAAQDRIVELEAQSRGAPAPQGPSGSFLGGGGPWTGQGGYAQAPRGGPGYAQQGAPQAGYGQGGYNQGGYNQGGYGQAEPQASGGVLGGLFGGGRPAQPGGFGSFLRQAGTAAAGVAGGEFLFSGLSNMFGGGRGGFGGGFGGPGENVTINEYGGGGGQDMGQGGYDDGGMDDGGYDDGGLN